MDVFGSVSSLFEEFEKDRSSTGTFITFNKTKDGDEDRSRIVFKMGASDTESSSDEDDEDESESRAHEQNETSHEDDSSFIIPNNLFNESQHHDNVVASENGLTNAAPKNVSDFKLMHESILHSLPQSLAVLNIGD